MPAHACHRPAKIKPTQPPRSRVCRPSVTHLSREERTPRGRGPRQPKGSAMTIQLAYLAALEASPANPGEVDGHLQALSRLISARGATKQLPPQQRTGTLDDRRLRAPGPLQDYA